MICTPQKLLSRGVLFVHQISPLAHSLLACFFQLGVQPAAKYSLCRAQLYQVCRIGKVARNEAANFSCAGVEALHVEAQLRVVLLVLATREL